VADLRGKKVSSKCNRSADRILVGRTLKQNSGADMSTFQLTRRIQDNQPPVKILTRKILMAD